MIRNIAKTVSKELDTIENWAFDSGKYCLCNKIYPKMKLWVANGYFFLSLYEYGTDSFKFNFAEKTLLWTKINKIIRKLNREEQTETLEEYYEKRILEK